MKVIFSLIIVVFMSAFLEGAVGCSLNDPDRDVVRIFPESTNYLTEYISIDSRGGAELKAELELRLGDAFDDKFEKTSVEYSYYTVLKGDEIIGRIHGLNQRGMFGGMQIILATDMQGIIKDFYYQKISSPEAKQFKAREFTSRFIGLSLKDFYLYAQGDNTRLAEITDPSQKSNQDFINTLRGIKKNLIQLDFFFLNREHDQYFHKIRLEDENE
jgi:hypothetical protein